MTFNVGKGGTRHSIAAFISCLVEVAVINLNNSPKFVVFENDRIHFDFHHCSIAFLRSCTNILSLQSASIAF